jgi:hypothetical protein
MNTLTKKDIKAFKKLNIKVPNPTRKNILECVKMGLYGAYIGVSLHNIIYAADPTIYMTTQFMYTGVYVTALSVVEMVDEDPGFEEKIALRHKSLERNNDFYHYLTDEEVKHKIHYRSSYIYPQQMGTCGKSGLIIENSI